MRSPLLLSLTGGDDAECNLSQLGRVAECGSRSRAAQRARSRLDRLPRRSGRRAHDMCDRRALVSILQRSTHSVCGRDELVLLGMEADGGVQLEVER